MAVKSDVAQLVIDPGHVSVDKNARIFEFVLLPPFEGKARVIWKRRVIANKVSKCAFFCCSKDLATLSQSGLEQGCA